MKYIWVEKNQRNKKARKEIIGKLIGICCIFLGTIAVLISFLYTIIHESILMKEQQTQNCFIVHVNYTKYECKEIINCDDGNPCEGDDVSCDKIEKDGSCCQEESECWAEFGTCVNFEVFFRFNAHIKNENVTCNLNDINCLRNKNETYLMKNETTCYVIPSINYISLKKYNAYDKVTISIILMCCPFFFPTIVLLSFFIWSLCDEYTAFKKIALNPFFAYFIKKSLQKQDNRYSPLVAIDRSFYYHKLFDWNIIKIIDNY